jgi:hypothetical protein
VIVSVSKTRLMTAATTVVAGLLLTGCGSASPGVALTVGDDEFTLRQVDTAAEHYCAAVEDQIAADPQAGAVPMSVVRQFMVQVLALRSQAEQFGADHGVEAGSTYLNAVAQSQGTADSMPEDARQTFVDVNTAQALARDIFGQVGAQLLEDGGVADPTDEQISQAGLDAFNEWPSTHTIEADPRFGLTEVDGVLTSADTSTSVAVSSTAKAALAERPDAGYVSSLPSVQRCGS